jgi:hypothetical protein
MLDWAELISDALCSQSANYLTVQSFYMEAYLVFVIAYCNVFDILPIKANVDIHNEPIQFLHPVLSKHKERYGFSLFKTILLNSSDTCWLGKNPRE